MARPIDAVKTAEIISEHFGISLDDLCDVFAAIPTEGCEPVAHGKWIPTKDDNKKECSNCEIIHLIAQYPHGQINYCPNCGARMDGES